MRIINLVCVQDEVFISICDRKGNGAIVNHVLNGKDLQLVGIPEMK